MRCISKPTGNQLILHGRRGDFKHLAVRTRYGRQCPLPIIQTRMKVSTVSRPVVTTPNRCSDLDLQSQGSFAISIPVTSPDPCATLIHDGYRHVLDKTRFDMELEIALTRVDDQVGIV